MTVMPLISAWHRDEVLYELHDKGPGPAGELPRHAHAEYQLSVTLGFPGEYDYRGARHAVPIGSLTVLHPGEAHVVRDPRDCDTDARYLMLYVPVHAFERAATDVAGSVRTAPFFSEPVILDPDLVRLATALHGASKAGAADLVHDQLRAETLARLVERGSGVRGDDDCPRRVRSAVARARTYLTERYAERVRLQELADVAGLSPHRLNRACREEVGVPPHRYQLNVRIDRAKALLARGGAIAAAAAAVGFADQAHLTRHFRRFVGLTPGRYLALDGKNVQDGS